MTRAKPLLVTVLLLGLAGFCVYLNRDRFKPQPIQIVHREMPRSNPLAQPPKGMPPNTPLVMFGFNRPLRPDSIQVFRVSDLEAGAGAVPLWDLVRVEKPPSMEGFHYGLPIRDMRPRMPSKTVEPLRYGESYRLVLKAEGRTLTHDFTPGAPQVQSP